MLAYELFTANKENDQTITKSITPIKKIIFDNNTIKIDSSYTTLSNDKSIKFLQEWLSMDLNNASYKQLQLADVSVQSSQRPAYVRIYCYLEKKMIKKDNYTHKIIMSIGKDDAKCVASYDADSGKLHFESLTDVLVRINKTNYHTSDQENLFDLYVSSKILNKDAILASKTFKKIVTEFVAYVKSQPKPDMSLVGKKITSFYLYVLPTSKGISKKDTVQKGPAFTDAFYNAAKLFSTNSTQTAKFLSSDDKAFTINCTSRDKLYENLGIGDTSLTKVELPIDKIMWISGFEWLFIYLDNLTIQFEQTKRGLLDQLHKNYTTLDQNAAISELSNMKIMCLERNQNKIEILLDENFTMLRQEHLFSKLKQDIPFNALEVMIPKTHGKGKKDWSYYMHVLQSFITGLPIQRQYFVDYFTRQAKAQLSEMLEKKSVASSFFERSHFMITYLSHNTSDLDHDMENDEDYAFRIGCMARKYIQFKRQHDDQNNSLLGILQYSKYDQSTLRNVLSKIGSGIALSKSNVPDDKKLNDNLTSIEQQMQNLIPQNEIASTGTDYSYFFYKGYFTGEKDED